MKREYKLTKFAFYETCNKYIGWDALSKQFLIKGIVGKNNPPVIKKFMTLFLLISCKILSSVKKRSFCETKRRLKLMYKKLSNLLNPSEDYFFAEYPGENKHKLKYFPAEFITIYAKIGCYVSQILRNSLTIKKIFLQCIKSGIQR